MVNVAITDVDILGRTCYWEARGESHKGQVAVCYVVLNRARIKGTSVAFEATKKFQFSCWNGEGTEKLMALGKENPQLELI